MGDNPSFFRNCGDGIVFCGLTHAGILQQRNPAVAQ